MLTINFDFKINLFKNKKYKHNKNIYEPNAPVFQDNEIPLAKYHDL